MKILFHSAVVMKWSFLVTSVWLTACTSNQPLTPLTERPAPDAEEVERPNWAKTTADSELLEPGSEDIPEPITAPMDKKEDMEETPASLEETAQPESEKKKKGFWSFLSRGDGKKDEKKNLEDPPEDEANEEAQAASPAKEEVPEDENPRLPRMDEQKGAYKLKSGDVLMISLTGSGGLNDQIETVVDEEGGVKLRFIGAVKADGLTPTELEREIEAEYTDRQKIYKDVVARVVVPNRFYFIGKEVRAPGRYPIVGKVSLSQAISAAGNFTEWANERKIILVRGNQRFEIDFREISKNPSEDILLQPGDNITVERRRLL